MNAQPDLFIDVVFIFVAAFAGGLGARALKLPALLGYLVVGIAIGPHALGFIGNVDDVQTIAGFGVVLLLFAVGVEISMVDLARVGRRVVLAGGGQIVGMLALGYAIGLALGWDVGQAVVFGMVLSLSSTMVVMKTLADRGAVGTLNGRITTGILLLQDLAFIPMVAVLPALAGGGASFLSDLGAGAAKVAAALGLVFVLGRRGIPWMLRHVALVGARESFIVTVVALAFAIAAVTSSMGLSAAMGAFLAGLVVSKSDWTGHRALREVTPLRDVFGAFFFVAIGMLVDVGFLLEHAPLVGVVVVAAVGVKLVLTAGLLRLLGYLAPTSVQVGFSLGQLGEFSFILAGSAAAMGVVDDSFLPVTVAAAVGTMAVTPGLIAAGERLASRLGRRRGAVPAPEDAAVEGLSGHVVLAGLGRVGSFIADELEQQHIPSIGIDMDPVVVERFHGLGRLIIHGDAASDALLAAAHIERARLLVIALPDPVSAVVTAQHARRLNPKLQIVGRVGWHEEAEALRRAGADAVVWPEMEAALEIMRVSLIDLGVSPERVVQLVEDARATLELAGDGGLDDVAVRRQEP
ncbi:MAG: cation:proton antiporter [Chloroflexi bacterium]|nr:cation:proton antiporter [Chloroflexota bacterium]